MKNKLFVLLLLATSYANAKCDNISDFCLKLNVNCGVEYVSCTKEIEKIEIQRDQFLNNCNQQFNQCQQQVNQCWQQYSECQITQN